MDCYGCSYGDCERFANYAKIGEKKKYCSEHIPDKNYVNVSNKICNYIDADGIRCTTTASFAPIGESKRLRCAKHKLPTDINPRHCIYKEDGKICLATASYGGPDRKRKYCSNHAPIGYEFLFIKQCQVEMCRNSALHEYRKLYCEDHKDLLTKKSRRKRKNKTNVAVSEKIYNADGVARRVVYGKKRMRVVDKMLAAERTREVEKGHIDEIDKLYNSYIPFANINDVKIIQSKSDEDHIDEIINDIILNKIKF